MKSQMLLFSVMLFSVILVFNTPASFGHGLGTETMPPVMIGDTEATLEVASTTTPDGVQQITFTLFETSSGNNINNVAFAVSLIKHDEELFANDFERDDGVLIMNFVPSEDAQVQIINQESFASFFGLASDQFNLKGKVFESGGLYEFYVKILAINDFSNNLSIPVEYDLGISIPETTYYEIDDVNFGKQKLGIITYFDQISEFSYDQTSKEVEFSFPFDWDQKTIDQTYVIHEELLVPKSFGDLLVSSFSANLNGIELDEEMINIDDFTGSERIVHLVISQKDLQEIFSANQFTDNKVTLKIKPSEENLPLSGVTENGQFKIRLWSESEIKSNSNVLLKYDVLDTFLKDRPISVPYELKIFYDGTEVLKKSGVSTGSKTQSDSFEFLVSSDVSGVVVVKFENLAGNKLANVEFPLVVDRKIAGGQEYLIPDWVKNNARWWSENQIDDKTFSNGIEFMIKAGIIVVPIVESEAENNEPVIPDWVRTNASWWANNQIDDKTFANGIEYLIKIGIIVV